MDFMERVANFNKVAQVVPPGKTFNADRVGFYTGCQLEELAEKLEVLAAAQISQFDRNQLFGFAGEMRGWGKAFKQGAFQGAVLRADREALLSEDIDVAVVTVGALCYQTLDFLQAAMAICDANDAKVVDGKVIRDPETNKVLKPAGWTPANLSKFIVNADN